MRHRRNHAQLRRQQCTGTEPATAASDLPARRALARLNAAIFLVGTTVFAYLAAIGHSDQPSRATAIVLAAVCLLGALLCLLDLRVIRRRWRERRRWGRPP